MRACTICGLTEFFQGLCLMHYREWWKEKTKALTKHQ